MAGQPLVQKVQEPHILRPLRLGISGIPHGPENVIGLKSADGAHLIRLRRGGHDDHKPILIRHITPPNAVSDLIPAASCPMEHKQGGQFPVCWRGLGDIYIPLPAVRIAAVRIVSAPHIGRKLFKSPLVDIARLSQGAVVSTRVAVDPVKKLCQDRFAVLPAHPRLPWPEISHHLCAPMLIHSAALLRMPDHPAPILHRRFHTVV